MNLTPYSHHVRVHRPPTPVTLKSRSSGFTLVEVMIGAVVMTLAISSSLIVMGRGFSSLDSARQVSYASQIMQSELERMRLTDWGDGTAAGNGATGVTAFPTTPTEVSKNTNFFETGDIGSRMTMMRTATHVHEGMIQVRLTVTWTTYDGRPVSRSYVTYYGRKGLYDFFSI